jgi:hypothetical protein
MQSGCGKSVCKIGVRPTGIVYEWCKGIGVALGLSGRRPGSLALCSREVVDVRLRRLTEISLRLCLLVVTGWFGLIDFCFKVRDQAAIGAGEIWIMRSHKNLPDTFIMPDVTTRCHEQRLEWRHSVEANSALGVVDASSVRIALGAGSQRIL